MDLGIRGRHAIVCASSKGLGRACALALAAEGVNLVVNARGAEALSRTADEARAAGAGEVIEVCADVTTADGRAQLLAACPQPDILVNNAGGPPPGDFHDWERADWVAALDANMLTPIELMRATIDGMCDRGFGRVVNITSVAVKSPIATLGLSNGARAGLTGFVAGLARQVAARGVTVNNLLPGPFDTDRMHANVRWAAESSGGSFEQEYEARRLRTPMQRFGDPREFGALCAFVCGAAAGYLNAQNIVVDGGGFPGTL